MSRIANAFSRQKRKKALIPYVTVGYPTIEATLEVVPLLAQNGADIVELGIPFSDPLADGVTIQRSSHQALLKGVTINTCLDVAEKLRKQTDVPLVFMTYYNPVFHYGLEAFCKDSAAAGVDGLIIPDLPPQEGGELEKVAPKHDLDLIYLLAPTSPPERIKLVASKSRGFIYLVSVTGVTGAREALPADLAAFADRVRKAASQPLCVGFGISTPQQAQRVAAIADGVIVGSRIIQLMENGDMGKVGEFIKELREALG
ncbi:MAG: tryptophan synthase subunit alpha [Dehalococcoidia bacterium]